MTNIQWYSILYILYSNSLG